MATADQRPDQQKQPDPSALTQIAIGTAAGVLAAKAAGSAADTPREAGASVLVPLKVIGEAGTKAAINTVLAGTTAFLEQSIKRDGLLLTNALSGSGGTHDEITSTIAAELDREREFSRRVQERLSRDLPKVYEIKDPIKRQQAMNGILAKERHYARQRSRAMAARAMAAVNREVTKRESPQGAYWKLSPYVSQHTPDCLAMGEKWWPWSVLDELHPPLHVGCQCRLIGWGDMVARGHVPIIPNETAAKRAAAHVKKLLIENHEYDLMMEETELGAISEVVASWGTATAN